MNVTKFHMPSGEVIECLSPDAPKKARLLCRYYGHVEIECDDGTFVAIEKALPGDPVHRFAAQAPADAGTPDLPPPAGDAPKGSTSRVTK